MKLPSAASRSYALCEVCGELGRYTKGSRCMCCGTPLHLRKTRSLERTWAFLIAAYVLYIPANMLPIMNTSSLFEAQQDTILSGIIFLWGEGSWGLATVVFIASICVPLLKLFSLTLLLIGVQGRKAGEPLPRAKLYRLLEIVGRWSMLDVYVVAILVALVHMQALALVTPGPGVLAFAVVVVLSMLATMSFDPRLIWDSAVTVEEDESREQN